MVNSDLTSLMRYLDYQFQDEGLLQRALSHRSVGSKNNERLEFLGDAVLGYVIASDLYQRFVEASEGELSRLRARLVKKETLAEIGRELELGDYLHLGIGELKSGGFRRDSILADAVEAIIGAVELDGGFAAAKAMIMRLYEPRLTRLTTSAGLKDPKTRLQEWLQGRGHPLPNYEVVEVEGESHQQTFTVSCQVEALQQQQTAQGSSRRKAEQAAAEQMLKGLEDD